MTLPVPPVRGLETTMNGCDLSRCPLSRLCQTGEGRSRPTPNEKGRFKWRFTIARQLKVELNKLSLYTLRPAC
jgi:hypothetical protein